MSYRSKESEMRVLQLQNVFYIPYGAIAKFFDSQSGSRVLNFSQLNFQNTSKPATELEICSVLTGNGISIDKEHFVLLVATVSKDKHLRKNNETGLHLIGTSVHYRIFPFLDSPHDTYFSHINIFSVETLCLKNIRYILGVSPKSTLGSMDSA